MAIDLGTLRVTTPDGQVREYPLDSATVYIGRAEGNGVVIDHVSVSRRHALLATNADETTTVTDLNSATGTFVGGQRIPANVATTVGQGVALRFGDAEARFIVQREAPSAPESRGAGSVEGQAPFTVSLKSPSEPVAAGSSTTATIVIQNRSAAVDEYTITVADVPAEWVRIARPQLALVPEARDELTIVIQPPKSSAATAGERPLTVAVLSREHKREVRVIGNFNIRSFEDIDFALKPSRSKGPFTATVSNSGNTAVVYNISAEVEGEGPELEFAVDGPRVELGPGETKTVPIRAKLTKRKLTGQPLTRQFSVEARPETGVVTRKNAMAVLTVSPPLRNWRYMAMALLVLIVGPIGWYSIPRICGGSYSECFDRGGSAKKAEPVKTPTEVPGTTPAATSPTSAAATGMRNGIKAKVINSPTGSCLAVRSDPTRQSDSNIVTRICDDKVVNIVSDKTETEGYVWWRVDDAAGITGWAAENLVSGGDAFLVPN